MIPPKGATAEGTLNYRKKRKDLVHDDKWRPLGEFWVSAVGLGTYLGNYDEATDQAYEESITIALEKGLNFIDTAINYRCQRSERVIGKILKELFSKKKIQRDEVVMATKGGFIPFDGLPPSNLEAYIREKWIETGVVKPEDVVSSCHCLHPAYLQNQIDASLANLQLDTIDIYYLHNPETQIPVIGANLFYERLLSAFRLLEENVERGRIQYYGLATWQAFRQTSVGAEAISLEKVCEIAKKAGGDGHHFRVIQLPYSLAMLEAIAVVGQSLEGKLYPILPVSYHYGISVMISAPLLQGQLAGLTNGLAKKIPGRESRAQKALQFVTSTPGVTAALVGAKQKRHLEENLEVLRLGNWDSETLQKICDSLYPSQ